MAANYVFNRTRGHMLRMNQVLSAAGRLTRRWAAGCMGSVVREAIVRAFGTEPGCAMIPAVPASPRLSVA
jgi:hypothetical protein